MERRKFTREFKLEAVRLIKERGVSYAQASQDLGVHTSQLRDCWRATTFTRLRRNLRRRYPCGCFSDRN
jgi:transposase-like protein